MNTNKYFSAACATAIMLALSACGGTPGGLGDDESYTPIAPLAGMSNADYQTLQSRNIVAQDGKDTVFSSLATSSNDGTKYDGPVGRRSGSIILSHGGTNGEQTKAPTVAYKNTTDTTNPVSLNADYPGQNGEMIVSGAPGQIGNQGVYLGRREVGGDETVILYIPRGDSDMYAGAYVSDIGGFRSAHGVFGRETTTAEMGRITGTASYTGAAVASIDSTQGVESGLYSGSSTATVNFDRNSIAINSTVQRDREQRAGTDTVGVSTSGTIASNGGISGVTTFSGVTADGITPSGNFDGNMFGPNGETVGGTFVGTTITDPNASNPNWINIVGHTVLNQN